MSELEREMLEALRWCRNHLKMLEEQLYPNSTERMRKFNSRVNADEVIAKFESQQKRGEG